MRTDTRVERLAKTLTAQVGADVTSKVIEGCEEIVATASPAKKAKWAKAAMDRLDAQVPEDIRMQVMEQCGRACIGRSTIERAKTARRSTKGLDEFLDRLNREHIGGGKLKRDGDIVYARYDRCYCGLVSATKEPISPTYCHCSRGWVLELFEQVFGKSVQVDLLQSIVQGAPFCQFAIHLPPDVG